MSTREHETQGSGVEPPVIDLDAEEVAAPGSAPDSEPEPAAEPASASRKPFPFRSVAATVLTVVAVVAGALAYRAFGERFWPGDRTMAMEERLATLDATTRTLTSQITAIGAAVDEIKASSAPLPARVDKATQAAGSAAEQVKSLGERVASVETDLGTNQEQLYSLKNQIKQLPATGGPAPGVSPDELEALAARIIALEETVAALKSAPPPPTQGDPADTARLSQALADLKANVASGTPYGEQSRTIAGLVPGIAGLDRLLPYAAIGLPTAAQLGSEIEAIATALPAPDSGKVQTADSGYWSGLSNLLSGIVTVRTIGESDWKEVGAKVASDIRTANLAAAVARLDDAEGIAPPAIEEWRVKAKARLGADAAVDEVSAAVLRVLSASAGKS